jgi:hypothetical protein
MALLPLIACTVPGRGRVEEQLHIHVAQVGEAAIERVLPAVFMGCAPIQGAVEMGQIERGRSRNADVLTPPLLLTGERGTGGAGAVGHHGKEGTCDSAIDVAALQWVGDAVGEAQALPQRFQDIERAIGPGLDDAPLSRVLPNLGGITGFQDTTGEVAQALRRFGILGAAASGENADFRALFVRIPHALGQLKRRDEGALSALLTGFTQVQVRKNKKVHP